MIRFPFLTRSALFLAFSLTVTAAAFAGGPKKTSPDLAHPTTSVVSVIVQYNTAPSAGEIQQLTTMGGITAPVILDSIHAVQISVPVSELPFIAQDGNVKYISVDRAVRAHDNKTASIATSTEYTVEPINAPAVWAMGYKGAGIGVAVIDSGISNVKDLAAVRGGTRIVYSQGFVTSQPNDANDHYGHGTHVAGLIGGNGTASLCHKPVRNKP